MFQFRIVIPSDRLCENSVMLRLAQHARILHYVISRT